MMVVSKEEIGQLKAEATETMETTKALLVDLNTFKRNTDELLEGVNKLSELISNKHIPSSWYIYISLEELDFSARTYNALKRRSGVNTVRDLLRMNREDFELTRNIGRGSLNEILQKMYSIGFDSWVLSINPRFQPSGSMGDPIAK